MSMTFPFTAPNRVLAGRRRGGTPMFVMIGLAVAVGLVGGLAWLLMRGGGDDLTATPLLAAVARGPYEHIVLEQGEVESSNNVEIRCEIKARAGASSVGPTTSVIDVIPEGEYVKEGDWLITFDSSALEQEANRQRIAVNTAEAIMIQAKALYDTAKISKDEYVEGTYNEIRKMIENEIFVAEENLKKAQLSFDSIKRQVARGTLTELQLDGEQFRVQAAQNDLDLANQKLEVLDQYTKVKMLTQLESDIQSAEVKYRNEQDTYQTELNDLKEFEDQIAKCTVIAPQPGQVVYANVQSSRSGSEFVLEPGVAVRERQVIIRLPDPTQMQVKATINESRINLVREGMPVTIRIDAFGDNSLQGEVTKVNKYAEAGEWWSSSAKEYSTLISIGEPPPQIRVGLTAEVQICVELRPNALTLPVQAVYERNGKTFCLAQNDLQYETREIVISSTDEKVVALEEELSELEEGELVVMNPRRHVDLFDESRFPEAQNEEDGETQNETPTPTPATVGNGDEQQERDVQPT